MSSGKVFSASEAYAAGLVQWVHSEATSPEEFFQACERRASEWLPQGPLALQALKALKVNSQAALEPLFLAEAKKFGELFRSKDTREGLGAFIDKRPANFKGH
jgi:enoyl-CoA hydratase/carnithine racemase